MSVFDFLKTAGRKVIEGMEAQSPSSSASATPSATAAPPAGGDMLSDKLTEYVHKLGLGLQNASVKLDGDKATIEGAAPDQASMEKAILAVGNVMGVSQVDSKITAPDTIEPVFYTVKSGDTLSKIAQEQYGHANMYMKIFDANTPLLKNPDDIFPGQKLRIPGATPAAQAA